MFENDDLTVALISIHFQALEQDSLLKILKVGMTNFAILI